MVLDVELFALCSPTSSIWNAAASREATSHKGSCGCAQWTRTRGLNLVHLLSDPSLLPVVDLQDCSSSRRLEGQG